MPRNTRLCQADGILRRGRKLGDHGKISRRPVKLPLQGRQLEIALAPVPDWNVNDESLCNGLNFTCLGLWQPLNKERFANQVEYPKGSAVAIFELTPTIDGLPTGIGSSVGDGGG